MKHESLNLAETERRLADDEPLADILADSEYQTKWTNHWDVNPYTHGGCFVRYNPDRQCYVVLYNRAKDPETGGGTLNHVEIELDEIWNETALQEACKQAPESFENSPYVGYTSDAKRNARELSAGGPSSSIDLEATKGSFPMHLLGYYGPYHLNAHTIDYDDETEYWDILESHDVPTDDYQ